MVSVGGSSAEEANVSVEGVMRSLSPSRSDSSTALSVTAAIGGLLVLLTLLVGGPIACICFVAMHVKRLRKRAKHARSLVFASQWRAQNPLLPFPLALHRASKDEENGEAAVEAEKGMIFTWPCFLYTEIPHDFNGLSTAFFQSPPPVILRGCSGTLPEIIHFNPGIGLKRQEQSVQCSHPLLSGSMLPSASSFTYFEVTVISFSKEKSSIRLPATTPERKAMANLEDRKEKMNAENETTLACADEETKEISLNGSLASRCIIEDMIETSNAAIQTDKGSLAPYKFDERKSEACQFTDKTSGFQAIASTDYRDYEIGAMQEIASEVVIEGTLAIGLAGRPAPPFRLPGRDAVSVALHSKSGRLFKSNLHDGEPFPAPPGWGKVGVTVGCGYDIATHTVCFTIGGVCYTTHFNALVPNASPQSHSDVDDDNPAVAASLASYPLFPTIGADCDVTVHVNFGQENFKFVPGSCSTLQP
ncbi:hypothetical protein L7F22_017415 [Adiantum nelumboides]|nr:hypothetical protein [Adiantum nelumboides]